MFGIAIGLLLGLLFSSLIFLIGYCLSDLFLYSKAEIVCKIITMVVCVAIVICSPLAGYSIEYHGNRTWYEWYAATKKTIESSLHNENLTGLERLELVKQASEANAELAQHVYASEQWYGFAEDPRVKNIQQIKLEESE